MKSWDAIVIGGGIIGLSLAIELRKSGMTVLIVERGEPGREASWAAGGMLADCGLEIPPALQDLATASARVYPEFVHELQDESGLRIDLRDQGTLLFLDAPADDSFRDSHALPASLQEMEPAISTTETPLYLRERCVDPRDLAAAAIAAARHRGVDFSSGDRVSAIDVAHGQVSGVTTEKTRFSGAVVINCAGAWAGQMGPHRLPVRPVKGQMLSVLVPGKNLVRHVLRTPDVYLIPRSDGRLLIGATLEEAGFDKKTVPETLQELRHAALELVPELRNAKILEAWAGLRPATPDALPILGETGTPGYFVATGHFRDGILLAPITAKVMTNVVMGAKPGFDLVAFSASRFDV